MSIQYIEPFQYKNNILHTRNEPYTSYKHTIIYKKTGFQMQAIMFNYSNIRKPVNNTKSYPTEVCINYTIL